MLGQLDVGSQSLRRKRKLQLTQDEDERLLVQNLFIYLAHAGTKKEALSDSASYFVNLEMHIHIDTSLLERWCASNMVRGFGTLKGLRL